MPNYDFQELDKLNGYLFLQRRRSCLSRESLNALSKVLSAALAEKWRCPLTVIEDMLNNCQPDGRNTSQR